MRTASQCKGIILPEKFLVEFQMIFAYFRNKISLFLLWRNNHLRTDKLITEAIFSFLYFITSTLIEP
jgi:hypothetical protein